MDEEEEKEEKEDADAGTNCLHIGQKSPEPKRRQGGTSEAKHSREPPHS